MNPFNIIYLIAHIPVSVLAKQQNHWRSRQTIRVQNKRQKKKKGGQFRRTESVILNAEKQNMAPKEFELAK